jgi:ABC-type lipopolysaccharide export system ATPase subunit
MHLEVKQVWVSNDRVMALKGVSFRAGSVADRRVHRRQRRRQDHVSILLVEQNSRMALRLTSWGYVLESGRIPLQGCSSALLNNDHVRQFYLGA